MQEINKKLDFSSVDDELTYAFKEKLALNWSDVIINCTHIKFTKISLNNSLQFNCNELISLNLSALKNFTSNENATFTSFKLAMLTLLLILIIWCTVFGNFLVFLAVYKERKLQNTTNFFLISLAMADCMVALFVMPTGLIVEILGSFPFSPFYCTIWIALDVLCCTSSIHHMSTMALDRYFTIKFPLKYGRNKSKRITLLKIITVWLISISICAPLLVLGLNDERNVYDREQRVCVLFNKTFRLYGSVFAFYIPFAIMLIAYVSTITILKRVLNKKIGESRKKLSPKLKSVAPVLDAILTQTSRLKNRSQSRSQSINLCQLNSLKTPAQTSSGNNRLSFINYQNVKNVANNERKALRVLIIIFSVFVTLWCPFFILNTLSALSENFTKKLFTDYEPFVYSLLTWLGYLSSAANPIVYTMFNKSFRIAFIKILTCKKVREKRYYFQRQQNSSLNNANNTVNNYHMTSNNSNNYTNNVYFKHETLEVPASPSQRQHQQIETFHFCDQLNDNFLNRRYSTIQ